jgi:hypothetical protein
MVGEYDVEHHVSIFHDTYVAQAMSKQLDQGSVISIVRRVERQKTDAERACCARTSNGHPAVATSPVMNSRRRIYDP